MDIDFFKQTNLDTSLAVCFPKAMTTVVPAVEEILKSRGKYIVPHDNISAEEARSIVQGATGDTRAYHLIPPTSAKVWEVLKEAVNSDSVRVLGVFHGSVPGGLPENMLVVDVGRSLHGKVSPAVQRSISDSMLSRTKHPTGDTSDIYYGILRLCYEALYDSDHKIFPKNVVKAIPVGRAFQFMYRGPGVLTPTSMGIAIDEFVEDIHGWME